MRRRCLWVRYPRHTVGYEARHLGGGRFRLRRRSRLGPVGLGIAVVVGAGVLTGLWRRIDEWAWHTAHLGAWAVVGGPLLLVLFAVLWRMSG